VKTEDAEDRHRSKANNRPKVKTKGQKPKLSAIAKQTGQANWKKLPTDKKPTKKDYGDLSFINKLLKALKAGAASGFVKGSAS